MITGAHVIIYTKNSAADLDFFKNILKFANVDVGNGRLIFALPPSEIGIHPTAGETSHELYLMCDDINAFVEQMKENKIACSVIKDQGWGILTEITLPGGGNLGVYQPRHARPEQMKI